MADMTHEKIEKVREKAKNREDSDFEEAIVELLDEMNQRSLQHEEDMRPVYDFFQTAANAKKGLVWIAGFLAAIGTIGFMFQKFGHFIISHLKL